MILNWIQKLNSGFSGLMAGKPVRSPLTGRGRGLSLFSSGFSSGLNLLCSCFRNITTVALGLAVFALFFVPSAALCLTPVQGNTIVNNASLNYAQGMTATSSVTVTVVIPAPSTVQIMTYSPGLSGADNVNVATTSYRSGSATGPLVALPAPLPVGTSTPINLSQPVPLSSTTQIHQGEPLFIVVTSPDQNLNPNVAETIFVTVTDPSTGDIEIVSLTETGPNTGVFAGYLPTTSAAATLYNGSLSVKDGDTIYVTYVDSNNNNYKAVSTVAVDPFGHVLDTQSGLPVNGAAITIINTATGLPATVFGNDGVSTFPSTITSGGSAKDSSGNLYSFPPGGYQFPFIPSGSYKFTVVPPTGYTFPSTVATTAIQSLPGAPFAIVTGSRGEVFTLNPGPAIHIDIPIDPSASGLWLQKTANKSSAGQGDFILYELTLTNNSKSVALAGVQVTDTLPIGFRYRSGSAKLNGVSIADPFISADGRTLTFNVGVLAAGISVTIDYVVEVTVGTRLGNATNNAIAGAGNGLKSNNASVTVTITDDLMKTKSFLMGRVSTGECNEKTGDGPNGVEGVRIYMEDGSFVISDKKGMFHFEGVRAGTHVVQMDLDSLPEGYEPFACTQNTRFAGQAFSQFVEIKGGVIWRTDFHIRKKKSSIKRAAPEPVKGEIVLEMANQLEKENIAYKVSMKGSDLPLVAARLNITLPQGVIYKKGSSMMDGVALADPLQQVQQEKDQLVFKLNDLPAGWRHEITFRAMPSADIKAGELVTKAYLAADGDGKAEVLTPPAETVLQLDKKVEVSKMPDIVLHPHFPVRGAELSAEDYKKLDELAIVLSGLRVEKIQVTGYTDNVLIAESHRSEYADNQALSLARAKSVGRYLMDKLHLPPEKLFIEGKGSENPIADNRTAEGKALNRRVELRISSSRVVDKSSLNVVKEQSGQMRAETKTAGKVIPVSPEADQKVKDNGDHSLSASEGHATIKAEPPTGVTASDKSGSAAQGASAATNPEESEPTINDPEGILYPSDKDILINSINGIRACLSSKLTPRLLIDDKEVSEDRIGFTMKDKKADKTIYSYIGVDFGKTGNHVVVFQGIDPFGNVRFKQAISVKRSGAIVSIRLKSAEGNVADGKTPVKLHLELYDADGTLIPAGTELEIREGTLSPLKKPDIFAAPPAAGSHPHVQMSREGEVLFAPVNNTGLYRVVLGYNNVTVEAETYANPKMRDWILVGLAEGTAGYNTVSGNMENLQNANVDENYYKDGRVAFFAKGQIKGKWLLTIAYDSAKVKENNGSGLFQTINPETNFTLYGDASAQKYDAASTNKLYIKIEREQFYAMFGDFNTGLTMTELSRYSRSMTGFKTEMQSKNYELNAFASQTDQLYSRDEIPGDGTSGIYRLSHHPIVPNSDKVTIEVRDRFHSEVVISSQSMSSFTDYSIDYDAGTILFKAPVYSRDQNLNPTIIVAEYETISTGNNNDYTYGGRAGVKLLDNKLKAGVTYIHEGDGDQSGNLYGTDATLKLDQNTKLRAEYAYSDYSGAASDSSYNHSGGAFLAELTHNTKLFDVKVYFREQEPGFGLGQQPGSEAGTRKAGVEGAYRFNDTLNVSADIYRQDNLLTDATRDVAEGKLGYTTKEYSASVGLLHASDQLTDGSNEESDQITLGGRLKTLNDRLTLTLDHAQSIINNNNSDFPTRTALGAEYAVSKTLTLLAAQEFTWGNGTNTQNTRLGMRTSLWDGATLSSTVNRAFDENDDRVFADVGLKQSWKINDAWKADAGLERSQTVANNEHYQFNTNVSPVSGSVQTATAISEDFTAASVGATYQIKKLTWDNRLELRLADSENKWSLMSGVVKEVDSSWAVSGRLQLFQTSDTSGPNTFKIDLRQGLVYRPPQTQWIALNRLDFIIDDLSGSGSSDYNSWRLVDNLMINYNPQKDLQISLHYGAKYVQEQIDSSDYIGYTDLIGIEGRYDINKDWDIGLDSSILHSWNSSQFDYSNGISAGYNLMQNVWVSIGYNITGFKDRDFSASDYTAQGPFIRFRMKFDQNSVSEAAKWLNGNNLREAENQGH
ncbi:MAG: OmpA family protein [Smithella sp.]